MGSIQLPNFMPYLLIWTLVAYVGEYLFFTSTLSEAVTNPTNSTASVLTARTTFVQFLTFNPPGMDPVMHLVLFFLVVLPWLIVLIMFIVSIIPFT